MRRQWRRRLGSGGEFSSCRLRENHRMDIDWKSVIAGISAIVSIIALRVSWWLWRETNRPIVTAEIRTIDATDLMTSYELVVHNCGNRPATNIHLEAQSEVIEAALSKSAPAPLREEVYRCFSREHRIPLLLPNGFTQNGFGITTLDSHNTLIHGSTIPIKIAYFDLQGRRFNSSLTLIVKNSLYFAGSGQRRVQPPS